MTSRDEKSELLKLDMEAVTDKEDGKFVRVDPDYFVLLDKSDRKGRKVEIALLGEIGRRAYLELCEESRQDELDWQFRIAWQIRNARQIERFRRTGNARFIW